ncbi:MAG: protein-glutamate O-methyltransferase, partial [Caldilineae bacterium]
MPSDVSAAVLAPFRDLIQKHSGLQVPDYRLPELKRVLDELLTTTGLQSLDALLQRLSGPIGLQDRQRLIHQMTVGETYFFRDGAQFKALEQEVLPLLIRQRRRVGSLRIWSAACSTGEEPYSLAILVHRLLRRELDGWRIVILGTDINHDALSRARQAQYRPWSLRATSDPIRGMYFQPIGEMWELRPEIRRMVTFQALNLVKDPYP